MRYFTLNLIAAISFSIFAEPTKVEINGGDAIRLTKIILGFSNPEINGFTRTLSAQTENGGFKIKCSSTNTIGIETDYFCSVELESEYINDSELHVVPAKKFKNLIGINIQAGRLQAHLERKLKSMPYLSAKTNIKIPREINGQSVSAPILQISCIKEDSCEVIMNFSL